MWTLSYRGPTPCERAREYIGAARALLEEARKELEEGNVRQAAEKLWGAAALAVKAYAAWREGKRPSSHSELWGYKDRLVEELGGWVVDAWNAGSAMHTCFYEGWCTRADVERDAVRVERLVREVELRVKGG